MWKCWIPPFLKGLREVVPVWVPNICDIVIEDRDSFQPVQWGQVFEVWAFCQVLTSFLKHVSIHFSLGLVASCRLVFMSSLGLKGWSLPSKNKWKSRRDLDKVREKPPFTVAVSFLRIKNVFILGHIYCLVKVNCCYLNIMLIKLMHGWLHL